MWWLWDGLLKIGTSGTLRHLGGKIDKIQRLTIGGRERQGGKHDLEFLFSVSRWVVVSSLSSREHRKKTG